MKELKIKGTISLNADYSNQNIDIQEEGKKYLTGLHNKILTFFYDKEITFPYEIKLDGEYEITIKKIK